MAVQQPKVVEPEEAEEEGHTNGIVVDKIDEPEIKVKTILKRPASTPSNLAAASNDVTNGEHDPVENLKKREEEYAKARLRILGSTGQYEDGGESNSS